MKAQLALERFTGPYRKVETLRAGADAKLLWHPVTIKVPHDRSPAYRQRAVRLEQEEQGALNVTAVGDRNAVEGAAVAPDVGRALLVREALAPAFPKELSDFVSSAEAGQKRGSQGSRMRGSNLEGSYRTLFVQRRSD